MATQVSYNGIVINNVLTESIDQTPIYDPSEADYLYTQFTVVASGIVYVSNLSSLDLGVPVNEIGEGVHTKIERHLNQPKQRFVYSVDGSIWYDVEGVSDRITSRTTVDVNNGPKPSFRVIQVIGTKALRVQFSIEFAVPLCSRGGSPGDILNLRFWVADDINGDNFMTTRIYQGRVRLAHQNIDPHAIRSVIVPPIADGFRRKRIAFNQSDNGLFYDFLIEDEEVYAVPPFPSTKWEATYTVATHKYGAISNEQVSIVLEGTKRTGRGVLLELAWRIIEAKASFIQRLRAERAIFLYSQYQEHLHANRIEAMCQVQSIGSKESTGSQFALHNILIKYLGRDLSMSGYNSQRQRPLPDPTAKTEHIFINALQHPCSRSLPAFRSRNLASSGGNNLRQKNVGTPTLYPNHNFGPYQARAQTSRSHEQAPYFSALITSDYDIDEGIVQLPFANLKSASAGAGAQASAAIIRAHQPIATRTVVYTATRMNRQPELPSRDSFKDNNGIVHRAISYEIEPDAPINAADGSKTLHKLTAKIIYALDRAPDPCRDRLQTGHVPYRGTKEVDINSLETSECVRPGKAGFLLGLATKEPPLK